MSILALIKLRELNINGLSRQTAMGSDSAFYCQKRIRVDSVSQVGYPSIENYIKAMLLISDNSANARVYEFVGHDYAHKKLKELGYPNVRLFNRLDGQCPGDTAKITPPVYFIGKNKDTIYKQGLTYFKENLTHPLKSSKAGKAHTTPGGKRINAPRDFASHNYLSMADLHSMMQKIIFNDVMPVKEQLPLSADDREFLIRQMGLYPRESDYPRYDKKTYYDSFKKYFFYGSAAAAIKQDSIRIINIVGRAFGFLIDCAYVVDFKNRVEFLLTAGVYVNEGDVIGNGKYEYNQLGLPFLKDLGAAIYKYEIRRKKDNLPDLGELEKLFK